MSSRINFNRNTTLLFASHWSHNVTLHASQPVPQHHTVWNSFAVVAIRCRRRTFGGWAFLIRVVIKRMDDQIEVDTCTGRLWACDRRMPGAFDIAATELHHRGLYRSIRNTVSLRRLRIISAYRSTRCDRRRFMVVPKQLNGRRTSDRDAASYRQLKDTPPCRRCWALT